jgi:hypothetical protein
MNPLNEVSLLDKKTEHLDSTNSSFNTIVEVAGILLVRKPLTAKQYFTYLNKFDRVNKQSADYWLWCNAYLIENKPLTLDIITNKFTKLKHRALLATNLASFETDVTINDDLPFEDTEDFTLPDGRRFTVKESGNDFSAFTAKFAEGRGNACAFMIPRSYKLNDKNINPDSYELPYPDGLGYEAATILCNHLFSVFQVSQSA